MMKLWLNWDFTYEKTKEEKFYKNKQDKKKKTIEAKRLILNKVKLKRKKKVPRKSKWCLIWEICEYSLEMYMVFGVISFAILCFFKFGLSITFQNYSLTLNHSGHYNLWKSSWSRLESKCHLWVDWIRLTDIYFLLNTRD